MYALLKREDEKWVTDHAYEHPMFVEDLVRDDAETPIGRTQPPAIADRTIQCSAFFQRGARFSVSSQPQCALAEDPQPKGCIARIANRAPIRHDGLQSLVRDLRADHNMGEPNQRGMQGEAHRFKPPIANRRGDLQPFFIEFRCLRIVAGKFHNEAEEGDRFDQHARLIQGTQDFQTAFKCCLRLLLSSQPGC